MPARKKLFSAGLPVWAASAPAAGGTPPDRWSVVAVSGAPTAKLVRRHPPASCGPRQVRLRLCGQLAAARALMRFGSVLWCFQVVMAAVPAPMAGLESRNGDGDGQTGKQAGPVEALGWADGAVGRRNTAVNLLDLRTCSPVLLLSTVLVLLM